MKLLHIIILVLLLAGICYIGYRIHVNESQSEPRRTASVTPDESELIVEMLCTGLRANSENKDADLYVVALTQTAMERFAACPEAAVPIKTVLGNHVEKSSPMIRYLQWELFLDSLNRSLIHCRNIETFEDVWQVRHQVIGEQDKAITEIVQQVEANLNALDANILLKPEQYKNDEKTSEKIKETKEMLVFLLGEIDATTDQNLKIENIRTQAIGIAKLIKTGFAADLQKLEETDLANERRVDTQTDGAKAFVPTRKKSDDKVWETGPYQRIMEKATRILERQADASIAYWYTFQTNEEEADTNEQKTIGTVLDEARRLQVIRYNLWATRCLANDPTIDELARIDTGFLVSSVAALYREQEDKLMKTKEDLPLRDHWVRTLLLTPKIGLNAF